MRHLYIKTSFPSFEKKYLKKSREALRKKVAGIHQVRKN
jgi:hypothetical protein